MLLLPILNLVILLMAGILIVDIGIHPVLAPNRRYQLWTLFIVSSVINVIITQDWLSMGVWVIVLALWYTRGRKWTQKNDLSG